jgi:signal transduction histidine kinase
MTHFETDTRKSPARQVVLASKLGESTSLPLPAMILDSMTSGILAVDLEGCILFVNNALSRDLNIDRGQWRQRPAQEIFHSVVSSVPAKRLPLYRLDSMRNSTRAHSREVELHDGERIVHLREDSGPLYEESGKLVGRLYAYHDLSWEKTIDQMKSEFISIASHELRTPMTSIKGAVDLILGGCTGEVSGESLELLQVAHSACERMIRLINDILDLSKIEAGQMKLSLTLVDLADVVNHCLATLKPLAAKDKITFELKHPQSLPRVEADRDRLEQVITNLVANAIKFSPVEGKIAVALAADAGWVTCSVVDQGCGIDDNDLDRIFGKFQQVGTPQRGGGTGLGLAITQALITEHRGKIWVESRLGEGARFVFKIPATVTRPLIPASP